MRVLVTGATGFVGGAVVPLLLERGHAVRIVTRRLETAIPGCETVTVGDIGPDTDWRSALDRIDAVVHLAARVHVQREREADPLGAFRRVNVEGTRRLAEDSAEAGVRRFLLLSSLAAVTSSARSEPVTDATIPAPDTFYGMSKREAEIALGEVGGRSPLEPTILRPPMIYGPDAPGNFGALLRSVRWRIPLPTKGAGNRRSVLYVENLADAVERALTHPSGTHGVFFVDDGEPVSTDELVRNIGLALGRAPRQFRLPNVVKQVAPRIPKLRSALEKLTGSLEVDSSRFRRELGWAPPFTTEMGLRRTIARRGSAQG